MGSIFKITKQRKEKARQRIGVCERGTNEEYYNDLLKTYKNFEDTRERVNQTQ